MCFSPAARERRTALGSTLGEVLMLQEPLALAMTLDDHELLQAARRRQAAKGHGHAQLVLSLTM